MIKRTFKDFLESDLQKTFFNTGEFATTIIFEGESVDILLDDDMLKQQQLKKGQTGAHKEELLFYVRKSQLLFYPRPDNIALFDNCRWLVKEVSEDLGMFTIKAERTSG